MNEERKIILQMLQDGEIGIEEAERLLSAVRTESSGDKHASDKLQREMTHLKVNPKRIRITVMEHGTIKVNLRVPFSLVKTGLKLGKSLSSLSARFVKNQEEAEILAMLETIDVDELIACLSEGNITLPHTIVDVDNSQGEHILIRLE